SANSLTSLSVNLSRVVGPALGAGLVAIVGPAAAFALNGLSFVASTAFLAPLLPVAVAAPAGEAALPAWRALRQGFTTVLSVPWLWISILVFALTNITMTGPYVVSMPFLVSDSMKADVGTLGLIYSVFPIGYVAGGIWLGRYQRLRRRG